MDFCKLSDKENDRGWYKSVLDLRLEHRLEVALQIVIAAGQLNLQTVRAHGSALVDQDDISPLSNPAVHLLTKHLRRSGTRPAVQDEYRIRCRMFTARGY